MAFQNKDEEELEMEREERRNYLRDERLGILKDSGVNVENRDACIRCGSPAVIGDKLCGACQQIWDHLE